MDILKVEKLTHEKWLNLYAATFQHGDHDGRWVFASRKPGDDPYKIAERCDAVLIVADPPRSRSAAAVGVGEGVSRPGRRLRHRLAGGTA